MDKCWVFKNSFITLWLKKDTFNRLEFSIFLLSDYKTFDLGFFKYRFVLGWQKKDRDD